MQYKFFGEPNMLVKEKKRTYFENTFQFKPIFRFDKNGEYITDNEKLIEKLKTRFRHVPLENDDVNDKDNKIMKCKKCDFETENKGLLMAHYREHKKED